MTLVSHADTVNVSSLPAVAEMLAKGSQSDIVTLCLLALDFAIESDAFLDCNTQRFATQIHEIESIKESIHKLLIAQILVDFLVANFTPDTAETAA
ncbi:hypothetical protein N836_00165 [Leptolyngbya sp. Heron Island J]|uniref:hypothetical protein n=1 Tax=Leptolyngbya sp. Heron Island J TaxID=1385935 RepID=UPI0003B96FFE|nr:hypothetical protein [Leptolyngbya sp. Heron Island J]ESA37128.1 hypothetical protein N836_00165 [Leptolyngbya sp. Heron Island J]